MQWHHTLEAPRSLLTGPDIALSAVEDPGFLVLHNALDQPKVFTPLLKKHGISWPDAVNPQPVADASQFALPRKDNSLWIFCDRQAAASLEKGFKALRKPHTASLSQRTGHFSALRLAGSAAAEVLAKICTIPLDFKRLAHPVPLIFLHGETLVVPEKDGQTLCWRVLVPRSEAAGLAERLISASLLQPRIGL